MGERGLKQRIIHEVGKFLRIFLYLAPFFYAFATYRMLLLNQFEEKYFAYGTAFVNALVLSKIILLGELWYPAPLSGPPCRARFATEPPR